MEDKNISPWQAMKKISKIIPGNYKYLLSIPMFYFALILLLAIFYFLGILVNVLALLIFLIMLLGMIKFFIVYPIVLVALFDVLKEN
jgi:glucan phosphoethanolaminetransferase (alkaline phosphatase superfamily)